MTPGRVLVVDDTKLITKMIHDKLIVSGYEVAEAYDGPEALKKLRSFSPDLIILDVMLPGMDGYQVARTVRQDPLAQHVPILMLTAKSGIKEKIAGFEAGADDYLTKPFDPTELELRARALISRARAARGGEAAPPQGKVISVFNLRGGAGTSLVAVNLAASLSQLFEQEVPLVDLAFETGGDSVLLDLMPRMTLAHLVKEELTSLDPTIVKEYLVKHASGIRLLAAPTSPVLDGEIKPVVMTEILTQLRGSYSHVVIDMPHALDELALAALDISDVILLVVPPDMLSLKAATGVLEAFSSLGYSENRAVVVLNRVFPRHGVLPKEIERALARKIRTILPYETDALVRSINEGVPLVLSQPSNPWAQGVEGLAFQLASAECKALAEAQGSKHYLAVKKRVAPPAGSQARS